MKNRPPDIMSIWDTEVASLLQWLTEHRKTCQKGVQIKQTHAPGLGTNTFIVCDCKLEINITDYSAW